MKGTGRSTALLLRTVAARGGTQGGRGNQIPSARLDRLEEARKKMVEGRDKLASRSALSPNEASQVFAAPMSLKSTPPLALSSFADSTMVIVTALGSTL